MWQVSIQEITSLRTSSGEKFTEFVDSLIKAQAQLLGILNSQIHSNLKISVADGGVDTKVDNGNSKDNSGWMIDKTCWQFKASSHATVTEKFCVDEIKKKYSSQLIKEGHAYRLCVCDSLPANNVQDREDAMATVVTQINPNAPRPRLLTADNLRDWVNEFPALILRYYREIHYASLCVSIRPWEQSITDVTPKYIETPQVKPLIARIRNHVQLDNSVDDVILPVQGWAGAGKTRTVFDALNTLELQKNFVVYCDDPENALKVARSFANSPNKYAILVADECPLAQRLNLEEILRGHKDRIRAITIDNTGERESGVAEYWVETADEKTIREILEVNFSDIPRNRRTMYADLSGGYIRLAADLCRTDPYAPGHDAYVGIHPIKEYLIKRHGEEQRDVIFALSLFTKVGFAGDQKEQLNMVCGICGINENNARKHVKSIKNTSGFIAIAGRFSYVTPEIIARIALQEAWEEWVKDDVKHFIANLSPQLLESFEQRIARSGTSEMREALKEFFFEWVEKIKIKDLKDIQIVERLKTIIKTDPDQFLPVLRNLINSATPSDLLTINGDDRHSYRPRRVIVWLMEEIAPFREYFTDAEDILYHLAMHETEKGIGNNATGIWKQLFRIFLSGTSVPFNDRINLLRDRILTAENEEFDLLFSAFDSLFEFYPSRRVGSSVVAGRPTPHDWQPQTTKEEHQCYESTVLLLKEFSQNDNNEIASRAERTTRKHSRKLLCMGFINELTSIYDKRQLDDQQLIELLNKVDNYFSYDVSNNPPTEDEDKKYVKRVSEWRKTLIPSDIHSRIVSIIGKQPWDLALTDETIIHWEVEIEELAKELFDHPLVLIKELSWFYSDEAASASFIGQAIGKLDLKGTLIDNVKSELIQSKSTGFPVGYFNGLLGTFPQHIETVNSLLDQLQNTDPDLAFDIFMSLDRFTDTYHRAIVLLESGKIASRLMRNFCLGGRLKLLNTNQFHKMIDVLLNTAEKGDNEAGWTALKLISTRLHNEKDVSPRPTLQENKMRELIWQVIEITIGVDSQDYYWWGKTIEKLSSIDPVRAASVTTQALARGTHDQKKKAGEILCEIVTQIPNNVMSNLDIIIFNDEYNMRFRYADKFPELFKKIPINSIKEWLKQRGIEGARCIARHLPLPYLDKNDDPKVPAITEYVLKTYEKDKEVFESFLTGCYDFEIYSGDIASEYEKKAEFAKRFLNYPLPRISEWARCVFEQSKSSATQMKQWLEERRLE